MKLNNIGGFCCHLSVSDMPQKQTSPFSHLDCKTMYDILLLENKYKAGCSKIIMGGRKGNLKKRDVWGGRVKMTH